MDPSDRIARLVGVIRLPIAVSDLGPRVDELMAEHGPGLIARTDIGRMLIYTPGVVCGCGRCIQADQDVLAAVGECRAFVGMVVCPHCGSKRCPRASDHESACAVAA